MGGMPSVPCGCMYTRHCIQPKLAPLECWRQIFDSKGESTDCPTYASVCFYVSWLDVVFCTFLKSWTLAFRFFLLVILLWWTRNSNIFAGKQSSAHQLLVLAIKLGEKSSAFWNACQTFSQCQKEGWHCPMNIRTRLWCGQAGSDTDTDKERQMLLFSPPEC